MYDNISPKLFEFPKLGDPTLGYISVAQVNDSVPFEIKRVYWTYYTPNEVIRGAHAHKTLHQLIFAVNGSITFTVEDSTGGHFTFVLNQPHVGLYLPPLTWREIQFSHSAVLLCLASEVFDESDYFRDYSEFKKCLSL
jgi:hypothetical protein